jgi:hypothetical protein
MAKRKRSNDQEIADFEAALLRSIEQCQTGNDQLHVVEKVNSLVSNHQVSTLTPHHDGSISVGRTQAALSVETLSYRGYIARVVVETEDGLLVGHVTNTSDIVGFHGSSADELAVAFRDAVDNYVAACGKLQKSTD